MNARMLFACGLLLCACPQQHPLPPPASANTCPAVCERLRSMSCELGKPTNRGHTCEELCVAMESNGASFVACTRTAPTCEAADFCQ